MGDPLADVIEDAVFAFGDMSVHQRSASAAAAARAHLAKEPPSETVRLVLEQQAANVRAIDGIVEALQADHAATQAELAAERARADQMAAYLRSEDCYDPSDVLAEHDAAREAAR